MLNNYANLTVMEAEGEAIGVLDEVLPQLPTHFSREVSMKEEIVVIKGSLKISP